MEGKELPIFTFGMVAGYPGGVKMLCDEYSFGQALTKTGRAPFGTVLRSRSCIHIRLHLGTALRLTQCRTADTGIDDVRKSDLAAYVMVPFCAGRLPRSRGSAE